MLLEGSRAGARLRKRKRDMKVCHRRFKSTFRPKLALIHPTHSTLGDDSVRSGPKRWDRAKRAKSFLTPLHLSSLPLLLPPGLISSTVWTHTTTLSKRTSYLTTPDPHGKGRDDAPRLKRRPFSLNVQQEFEAGAELRGALGDVQLALEGFYHEAKRMSRGHFTAVDPRGCHLCIPSQRSTSNSESTSSYRQTGHRSTHPLGIDLVGRSPALCIRILNPLALALQLMPNGLDGPSTHTLCSATSNKTQLRNQKRAMCRTQEDLKQARGNLADDAFPSNRRRADACTTKRESFVEVLPRP